jgi:hypothetical protein
MAPRWVALWVSQLAVQKGVLTAVRLAALTGGNSAVRWAADSAARWAKSRAGWTERSMVELWGSLWAGRLGERKADDSVVW